MSQENKEIDAIENAAAQLDSDALSLRMNSSTWRIGTEVSKATWSSAEAKLLHDDMMSSVSRMYAKAERLRAAKSIKEAA